jgi:Uma2 family endonuclease
VKLGWLINPHYQLEVYELGKAVVPQPLPAMLSSGALMPGFKIGFEQF